MTRTPDAAERFFPTLTAGDAASRLLLASAQTLEIPADQPIFHAGSACRHYVLVVDGTIRVQVIGQGGREAVLYRVLPGQACVLTTCCILSGDPYPAEGFSESPVRALSFSKPIFDRGLEEAPAFRRLVFANLGQRLAEVICRMEELAFRPVETRLAAFLLERGEREPGRTLALTHQEIAIELGSAREVISRHLKLMEKAGLVALGRSSLRVRDPVGLMRLRDGPR